MDPKPTYRVTVARMEPFVMYNYTGNHWYGYSIDLIEKISKILNFDYDIRESSDGRFGTLWDNGAWDGMVLDLLEKKSDIAAAPLWITYDRQTAVDFTIPYYEQTGFSILMQRREKSIPFQKFLLVFEIEVWISFAAAFFLTATLSCLYERYSPYSSSNNREKYKNNVTERFGNLKECFWFTVTTITPQGGGVIPKNLSGKSAIATWWLFGFVIVAAYTANLAGHETLDRLEKHVESFDDLINQNYIEYGVLKYSYAHRYFFMMWAAEEILSEKLKDMILDDSVSDYERGRLVVWDYPLSEKFTNIYQSLRTTGFIPDMSKAVRKVRRIGTLHEFALIAEAVQVKYLAMTNCDLRELGDQFAKKPYGIALQKGSPLTERFNYALLKLMDDGILDELKKKWWDDNPLNKHCSPEDDVNVGFGLQYMGLVFVLIFIGIILATMILSVQYWWYCYRFKDNVQHIIPRNVRN